MISATSCEYGQWYFQCCHGPCLGIIFVIKDYFKLCYFWKRQQILSCSAVHLCTRQSLKSYTSNQKMLQIAHNDNWHTPTINYNEQSDRIHTQLFKSRKKKVFERRAMSRDSRQCLASAVSALICSGAFGRMRKNSISLANNFRCTHRLTWREGRRPSSLRSKSSGHNNIHNISLNCYRNASVSGMLLWYHSVKKCERQQCDGITWALCQSRISGDVCWVSRDRAIRFISGPKISHSCFVQCLLHDEGF